MKILSLTALSLAVVGGAGVAQAAWQDSEPHWKTLERIERQQERERRERAQQRNDEQSRDDHAHNPPPQVNDSERTSGRAEPN